jgi:ATP-binding cassette subfamily B (MDR/TAP) protein 1
MKSPNLGVMYGIEYFCIFAGYALAFWQGVNMYNSGQIDDAGKVITYVIQVLNFRKSSNSH